MASRLLLLSLVFILLPFSRAVAETPVKAAAPMAFEFSYAEPADGQEGKFPYFRAFPDGKDKHGRDASGALGTLKFARGASKLYTKEDAQPGMIVVLRRILFIPLRSGDYEAILEGEFNAVRTLVKKEIIEKLLAGETTDLVFVSDITKGIRPVAYNVKAKTYFRAAMRGGDLHFYGGEGGSAVTHYGLTGNTTYESDPVPLGSPDNMKPIYIGKFVKPKLHSDGRPETLPIIN
jgi:hypothetical protein